MSHDASALRRAIREQRRTAPASERIAAAEQIAEHLLALPFLTGHGLTGHVAGYWAVDGEIGLHAWQLRLPPTVSYCLPVLHGDRLRFAPWRPGAALVSNRYGIPEPDVAVDTLLDAEDMALVVAPLVAFDASCHRLGMGAGWYDRSFAFRRDRPAPPWLVGAAFARQQVETIAVEPWDVPMDAICTERETFLAPPGPE
jgi:5-formyltetrahydrofolate cyclo-ligase